MSLPIDPNLGKNLESTAKGAGAWMDQLSNNKGGRVVIGLLVAVVIGLIYVIINVKNNGNRLENKNDTSKQETVELLKNQIADLKTELAETKKDLKESYQYSRHIDSMNYEAAATIKRLNSIIDIQKSKK